MPTHAETGYGYLNAGNKIENGPGLLLSKFVEKPEKKLAEQFLESGNYLWNSGMFIFPTAEIKTQLNSLAPEIFKSASAAFEKANKAF